MNHMRELTIQAAVSTKPSFHQIADIEKSMTPCKSQLNIQAA